MPLVLPFPMAIMGETEAHAAARTVPAWALLSIRGHEHCPEPAGMSMQGPRLTLFFDDLTRRPLSPLTLSFPTHLHAKSIVSFAKVLDRKPPQGCVVHCAAGISRSSAAALGVAMTLLGDTKLALMALHGAVDYAFEQNWRDDVSVYPNLRLTALLDRELGCDGALVRAMCSAYGVQRGQSVDSTVETALLDIEGD